MDKKAKNPKKPKQTKTKDDAVGQWRIGRFHPQPSIDPGRSTDSPR
jgi:hypothetical protein